MVLTVLPRERPQAAEPEATTMDGEYRRSEHPELDSREESQCAERSCTPPVTSASRSAPTRRSSRPPTPSFAPWPPASADPTCGRTAASTSSRSRGRSATSTVGIVEEVGDDVRTIQPGQFVVGGFFASDNTCPHCRAGFQSNCQQGSGYDGCQSEWIRIPLADGTLVATPDQPPDDLIPSLLTLSDVMSTGWHAAVSAGVQPGMTVAVVGDGAVGLCGVLAASQLGAERVIVMSRHADPPETGRKSSAPPTS